MSSYETIQPSLEFMKEIVKLADKCLEHDADIAKFTIGPVDGIAMEVAIEFRYKEV